MLIKDDHQKINILMLDLHSIEIIKDNLLPFSSAKKPKRRSHQPPITIPIRSRIGIPSSISIPIHPVCKTTVFLCSKAHNITEPTTVFQQPPRSPRKQPPMAHQLFPKLAIHLPRRLIHFLRQVPRSSRQLDQAVKHPNEA